MRLQIGHGVPPVVIGLFVMALGSGQNYQFPFRGVAAPLRGANHITVSSFLFRRGVVFSLRRVFVSSWRRVFVLSFLFRRGVVFSSRLVFVSSWRRVFVSSFLFCRGVQFVSSSSFRRVVVTGNNWSGGHFDQWSK